jgi:hypothetical protein
MENKIVSNDLGYVLDTETGEIEFDGSLAKIELTGRPYMICENMLKRLDVYYDDHIDSFEESGNLEFRTIIKNDPTYLGSYFSPCGITHYYKIGDDLLCGDYINANFFLGCQRLLYITFPRPKWYDEDDFEDYSDDSNCRIHYIDMDGKIRGQKPIFTKIGEITILVDICLCIFDSGNKIFIYTGFDPIGYLYGKLTELVIADIEIYPNVCQIYTTDGEYTLCKNGLSKNTKLGIVTKTQIPTKSARKV